MTKDKTERPVHPGMVVLVYNHGAVQAFGEFARLNEIHE